MFITVNDRPLNIYSIMYHYERDTVNRDGTTTYSVFYRLTDGRVIEEQFASAEEREVQIKFVDEATTGGLVTKDSFTDFPEAGGRDSVYLAKDTGQAWYWDTATQTYIKVGIAGRTGVYSYDAALPNKIGSKTVIKKSDLLELVPCTVPYTDGSEVISNNHIRAVIISSTDTEVTAKTVADMIIDSFQQFETEADLPTKGAFNVLYFIKDLAKFKVWDGTSYINNDATSINGLKVFTIPDASAYDRRNVINSKVLPYINSLDDLKNSIFLVFNGQLDHSGIYFFNESQKSSNQYNLTYHKADTPLSEGISSEASSLRTMESKLSVSISLDFTECLNVSQSGHQTIITNVLNPYVDYTTPYEPLYAGSPTTKKYVDAEVSKLKAYTDSQDSSITQHINTINAGLTDEISRVEQESIQRDDVITEALNAYKQEIANKFETEYKVFEDNSFVWDNLTQEERDSYFLAKIIPVIEDLDENQEIQLQSILLNEIPTQTVEDMTEQEVDTQLTRVVEGADK